MEWYEWVFDGIGTTIIAVSCSYISYKSAIKQIGKQSQVAGDNSKQKQELIVEGKEDKYNVQKTIRQTQKAGKHAKQIQCGEFKSRK